MTRTWDPAMPGVLGLPSGRLIRGRALRRPISDTELPDFGLYLFSAPPTPTDWEQRWVRWPDFRLPANKRYARDALLEAWRRAPHERVEVVCGGGRGRTGTALACLAVLDGVPADEAVGFVRERYDARAVETPWQRRYIRRFASV